jgi:hypothetical protein
MKRMTLIFAVLAISGTGVVIWQRHSLSEFQENQNRRLHHETGTGISNAEAAAIEQEVTALREETKELPKLRNEVSQFRATQIELTKARAENARLLEAKRTGLSIPREAPPGFILKEQLKNAGFATPEAAVQTFFWAMSQGDLGTMLQALSAGSEDKKHIENSPPEERAELELKVKADRNRNPMNNFRDFAVRQKEVISDTAVVLYVGSSPSTKTTKIQMEQNGGEWRLRDLPQ